MPRQRDRASYACLDCDDGYCSEPRCMCGCHYPGYASHSEETS